MNGCNNRGDYSLETLNDLLKAFEKANGSNENYTNKDLMKSIVAKLDKLDDKIEKQYKDITENYQQRCNELNKTMNNHINHLTSAQYESANRITRVETSLTDLKWLLRGITMILVALIIESVFVWMA